MLLRKGDSGPNVRKLQSLLRDAFGYAVDVDGDFGPQTERAVKQFQSNFHDQHGNPLVVDGRVGDLTWWALNNRNTERPVEPPPPQPASGGSGCGKKALAVALSELAKGAGEVGGDNKGPWVAKYLAGAGLKEGQPWCASFVSWCFLQACGGDKKKMPFPYLAGARNLYRACEKKGFVVQEPAAGDLIVWWRESLSSGKGHIGFVESVKDGYVYTVEGNKSPKVARFKYVKGRIDKLIGFVRVPDKAC